MMIKRDVERFFEHFERLSENDINRVLMYKNQFAVAFSDEEVKAGLVLEKSENISGGVRLTISGKVFDVLLNKDLPLYESDFKKTSSELVDKANFDSCIDFFSNYGKVMVPEGGFTKFKNLDSLIEKAMSYIKDSIFEVTDFNENDFIGKIPEGLSVTYGKILADSPFIDYNIWQEIYTQKKDDNKLNCSRVAAYRVTESKDTGNGIKFFLVPVITGEGIKWGVFFPSGTKHTVFSEAMALRHGNLKFKVVFGDKIESVYNISPDDLFKICKDYLAENE